MAEDVAGNTRMSSSIQTTCRDAARFGAAQPEGPSGLRLLGDTAKVVTEALG